MKDKVIALLKVLYPGVNLSKTRLDKIADSVVAKITTEDEITDKLNEYNDLMPFADIAKSDDRQRAADAKRVKDEADAKAKADADAAAAAGQGDDQDEMPKWMKGVMSKIDSLESKLAGEQGKSTINDLVAAAKLKGIPGSLAAEYQIGEGYDQETALTALETKWTELKQIAVNGEVKDGKVIIGDATPAGTPAAKAAIKSGMEEAVKGLIETV